MREFEIGTVRVDPGSLFYLPLSSLACGARAYKIDFHDWGLCEVDDFYWLGTRCVSKEKDVLQVSVLDAFEKRDEQYPDHGDEEVLLFAGRDKDSRRFTWWLLSEEEYKRAVKERALRKRCS